MFVPWIIAIRLVLIAGLMISGDVGKVADR
jgi:hypothetical protein